LESLIPAYRTEDGDSPGTPGYMAPEQIRGEKVDFRADLFAFGLVVYELARGLNPFAAGTSTATMARILEIDPPPLSAAGRTDLVALDRIVATCLSKDPAGRYRSTLELVAALERFDPETIASVDRGDHAPGASVRAPRWWWEFHQAAVSVVYVLMMYPVWRVRVWFTQPWGTLFVLAMLACTATSTTLRLHVWFTSRSYPSELSAERRRVRAWTRACDAGLTLVLLAATVHLGIDHQAIAVLFVTVAIGTALAAFVIEPTTTRAAFGSRGSI
jgi:hypothetical protein